LGAAMGSVESGKTVAYCILVAYRNATKDERHGSAQGQKDLHPQAATGGVA